MHKLGIAGLVVDESSKICGAQLLVGVVAPKSAGPIHKGRLFMRAWLELTRLNLYGAPLSLLTDDPASLLGLETEFGLPPEQTLANVLRVGFLPKGYRRYQAARVVHPVQGVRQ